jgi:hypothetical protein
MKLSILAAAAAALVTTSFAAAPADAQMGQRERTVVRTDGDRTVVRTDGDRTVVRTRTVVRDDRRHDGWQRGNHYGWRNNHRRTRVCRTVWRNHHRSQVCTMRYR